MIFVVIFAYSTFPKFTLRGSLLNKVKVPWFIIRHHLVTCDKFPFEEDLHGRPAVDCYVASYSL